MKVATATRQFRKFSKANVQDNQRLGKKAKKILELKKVMRETNKNGTQWVPFFIIKTTLYYFKCNSMRRFCARPCAVSLEATGRASP